MTADTCQLMEHFRIASRDIYNQYFRLSDPARMEDWDCWKAFSEVEDILFKKLVTQRLGLSDVEYGVVYPSIVVSPICDSVPWMLNRKTNVSHGYWDHEISRFERAAIAEFVHFFDFDEQAYRDNRYVMIFVRNFPEKPEAQGRFALVESNHVKYSTA